MSVYLDQHLDTLVFKAILKDPNGGEEIEGRAEINLQEQYIDFRGDFVPLYSLGSPMEIYRLYGKREIHRFCGQVYLSDTNLMRLIKVTDQPLPSAIDVCCTGVTIPAEVTYTYTVPVQGGLFFKKTKKESESFSASITAMTQAQVELLIQHDDPFKEGEEFQITALQPPLFDNTTVTIRKVFTYGDTSSYLCAIGNESTVQRKQRDVFLEENQVKPHHFFAPIGSSRS